MAINEKDLEKKTEKQYPWLGKREYKGQEYVILFCEENYGVVVMSNITEVEEIKFGHIGDFNENLFEPLEPNRCVRLNN